MEINFESGDAGLLAVNRDQVSLTKKGTRAVAFVLRRINRMQRHLSSMDLANRYAALNHRVAGLHLPTKAPLWWLNTVDIEDPSRKNRYIQRRFEKVSFPVSLRELGDDYLYLTREVITYAHLSVARAENNVQFFTWYSESTPPDRIVIVPEAGLTGIWTQEPKDTAPVAETMVPIRAAPAMQSICGFRFSGYDGGPFFVNLDNPVVRAINFHASAWVFRLFGSDLDPRQHRDELTGNRSNAAAWILQCLLYRQQNLWRGLLQRESNLLRLIWETASLDAKMVISAWFEETSLRTAELNWGEVEVVSLGAWARSPGKTFFDGLVSQLTPEWVLTKKSSINSSEA